jgi:hypothetical protein
MISRNCLLIAGSTLLGLPSVAFAHHSFSAFNRSESAKRSINGTVRDFQLINPHGWLKIVASEANGRTGSWSFEMTSSAQLQKRGWAPNLVHPGDKVTVTYYPLRFGSYGGQVISVKLPDGRTMNGVAESERGYPGQQ